MIHMNYYSYKLAGQQNTFSLSQPKKEPAAASLHSTDPIDSSTHLRINRYSLALIFTPLFHTCAL